MRKLFMLLMSMIFLAQLSMAKVSNPKLYNTVRKLLKGAQIVGIEESPIKGLYIVFIKKGERQGALMISEDGKYIITGNLINVSDPNKPESVIRKIGEEKGYIKPPKAQKKVDMSKINLKDTPRFGKKDVPEVIVYYDPTCPFCKKELSTLKELTDEGKAAMYLKYFIVHGEHARKKAEKAECIREAYGENAFWDYLLKGKEPKKEPKCDMKKIKARIKRDEKEARELGIRGTPTWIINGKMHVGYVGKSTMEKIIDKEKSNKVKK